MYVPCPPSHAYERPEPHALPPPNQSRLLCRLNSLPASTLRTRVIGPFGAHSASANASMETLRPHASEAPPRHAHEYVRERPSLQRLPRIVTVPEARPGIAEDVRASYAGGEVQFGEAV